MTLFQTFPESPCSLGLSEARRRCYRGFLRPALHRSRPGFHTSNSLYRHCVRLTNYHNPYDSVLKLSNVKRVGVSPRAGGVGLPENAPAKAVGVDCGARFLQTHPVTNPVVDPISHGWYFDDSVSLKDLTFTLAGDMDRNVIPTRVTTPTLSLAEK